MKIGAAPILSSVCFAACETRQEPLRTERIAASTASRPNYCEYLSRIRHCKHLRFVLDEWTVGTRKSFVISLLAVLGFHSPRTHPVGSEEVMTQLGITCCSTGARRIS